MIHWSRDNSAITVLKTAHRIADFIFNVWDEISCNKDNHITKRLNGKSVFGSPTLQHWDSHLNLRLTGCEGTLLLRANVCSVTTAIPNRQKWSEKYWTPWALKKLWLRPVYWKGDTDHHRTWASLFPEPLPKFSVLMKRLFLAAWMPLITLDIYATQWSNPSHSSPMAPKDSLWNGPASATYAISSSQWCRLFLSMVTSTRQSCAPC